MFYLHNHGYQQNLADKDVLSCLTIWYKNMGVIIVKRIMLTKNKMQVDNRNDIL